MKLLLVNFAKEHLTRPTKLYNIETEANLVNSVGEQKVSHNFSCIGRLLTMKWQRANRRMKSLTLISNQMQSRSIDPKE
jgi:hypothetical protein